MRRCKLCNEPIGDSEPVHSLSGNHWKCEVRADNVPDWQPVLADALTGMPAVDHTPRDSAPDYCPLCGEDRNHKSQIIRGGHKC